MTFGVVRRIVLCSCEPPTLPVEYPKIGSELTAGLVTAPALITLCSSKETFQPGSPTRARA